MAFVFTSNALVSLVGLLTAVSVAAETPFGIRVVDEASGHGIPMATLSTNHGLQLVTDSGGWALFDEPDLMGCRVYFSLSSPGYAFPRDDKGFTGTQLIPTPDGRATLKMIRLNIAERVCRLTGSGVYRDSSILEGGRQLPSLHKSPDICRQSISQATVHDGKIFWVWKRSELCSDPLAEVACVGATSDLAAGAPDSGVLFEALLSKSGAPQSLFPQAEGVMPELDGLISVTGSDGQAHLLARYRLLSMAGATLEQGIAEFRKEGKFEAIVRLGNEYEWQFPQGQAVRVKTDGTEWIYFATPFCHVRVPANYEAIRSPTSYQALTLMEGAGKLVWQQAVRPMTAEDEARWLQHEMLEASQARTQVRDAESRRRIELAGGSVRWNEFRKRWIMLAARGLDEIWYAEAASAEGPWRRAVKVLDVPGCDIQRPSQHEFMDQEGGRIVYFEGCHSGMGTPYYEGNQMLYRVDLSDARLGAAQRD